MTTDHAAVVREGIMADSGYDPDEALAALDALVAERDEALRERENAQFELRGLDLVRQKDNGYLIGQRDTLAAALRDAVVCIEAAHGVDTWDEYLDMDKDAIIERARAALASVSPPTQRNPAA